MSVLGFIGVPSFSVIVGWLIRVVRSEKKERDTLKKGVQAMLRSQMINDYNKWYVDKGYAPIWAKDNFENVWVQYESLGDNGVMNKIHNEFMSLPTEPPKREETANKGAF